MEEKGLFIIIKDDIVHEVLDNVSRKILLREPEEEELENLIQSLDSDSVIIIDGLDEEDLT